MLDRAVPLIWHTVSHSKLWGCQYKDKIHNCSCKSQSPKCYQNPFISAWTCSHTTCWWQYLWLELVIIWWVKQLVQTCAKSCARTCQFVYICCFIRTPHSVL